MSASFELKGWHVLAGLLGMFGLVVAVNVIYIVVAIGSFPGEDVPKSYLQGLHYNETLASRAAQAALGWRASVVTKVDDTVAEITITIVNRDGATLKDLTVEGVLRRPASDSSDHAVTFSEVAEGYRATIDSVKPGQWDLRLTARDPSEHTFTAEKRLWLP